MKKTTLIISFCLATILASAQNNDSKGGLLERVTIETSLSYGSALNFNFGPGIISNHPNRSINTSASIRIGEWVDVGGYLSLMGCSPEGYSEATTVGTTELYTLGWNDNKYHIGGGAIIELHSVAFRDRDKTNKWMDMVVRCGFGKGGLHDGFFWGGLGEEMRLSHNMRIFIYIDYGNNHFADLEEVTDNSVGWNCTIGLHFSLK